MNRPWMPLYIADYRADTAHLDAAQHGAYLLLIMHYWQTGALPIEDAPLSRIACMTSSEWRKAKPVVAAFFTAEWRHKRIDAELAKAAEISSKRRASAEQRHNKSNANAHANAQQLDTHAGATSPSQSQKQEDTAGAVPTYEFESGIIRLTPSDFEKWKTSFSYLDLRAELLALTDWAQQPAQREKWFFAVSGALAKRNREAKGKADKQQQQPFKWNGLEGVT